jgi:hypothetical protein
MAKTSGPPKDFLMMARIGISWLIGAEKRNCGLIRKTLQRSLKHCRV